MAGSDVVLRPGVVNRAKDRARTEPPYNVILHNDFQNGMGRVVYVLKKTVPNMIIKRAAKIVYTAHTEGKAILTSCHTKLAEVYEGRLKATKLTDSTEPG